MEIVMETLLGKLGRQCYEVLCLGVLLVSVTIARYVCDGAADNVTTAPPAVFMACRVHLFVDSTDERPKLYYSGWPIQVIHCAYSDVV